MRLLITGGAGCLGANLVAHLQPQGHEILVIDNFTTGRREALPPLPGLAVEDGSVADRGLVDAAFERFRPTHVIHAAAAYQDPDDWREDAATNLGGAINIVAACRSTGVERLVNFQTALCYGRPERTPIPVDHPTRPFTSYGISKTAAEAYIAISGLSWVSLRIANVIAPHLAIGPIPTFYQRLKAGRPCFCTAAVRDFLDIADFLDLVDIALRADAPTGMFNVSTGEGHTIAEVFDAVAAHLGIRALRARAGRAAGRRRRSRGRARPVSHQRDVRLARKSGLCQLGSPDAALVRQKRRAGDPQPPAPGRR